MRYDDSVPENQERLVARRSQQLADEYEHGREVWRAVLLNSVAILPDGTVTNLVSAEDRTALSSNAEDADARISKYVTQLMHDHGTLILEQGITQNPC